MSKLRRFLLEGHCYHATATTRDRRAIFQDSANARIVVDALQFLRRDRAYLLAYVIMPDHLHAILVPREDQTISRLMQSVKGYSARVINQRQKRRGALWQSSFYDHVIRDESHLLETVEYIHRNPVACGRAQKPEEYPFSSAYPGAETDLCVFLAG